MVRTLWTLVARSRGSMDTSTRRRKRERERDASLGQSNKETPAISQIECKAHKMTG